MKKKRKIIIFCLCAGVLLLFFAVRECKQKLDDVLAWEDVHIILYAYHTVFRTHPERAEKISGEPVEVSHISAGVDWNVAPSPPYSDRWGTPMKFYFIRKNGILYGKGISAGADRRFRTADDVIDSEYDDSGTVFRSRRHQ